MTPCFWTGFLMDYAPEEMVTTFAAKGWRHLELSSEHAEALLARGEPRQVGATFKRFAADAGSGDQHLLPFGRGTVDWAAVTAALVVLPYGGMFNFEVPGERRCPLAVRLAKLDYVREILPVLLGNERRSVPENQSGGRAP